MQPKPKLYVPDYVGYAQPFEQMFEIVYDSKHSYDEEKLRSCDFLLLTGGGDINPKYYGHQKSVRTMSYNSEYRDGREFKLGQTAIAADIPIIGICRGAQWITIFAGGSLIQHVTGHAHGSHLVHVEGSNEKLEMSSVHHQMCNLTGIPHILYAWTNRLSTMYIGGGDKPMFLKGLNREPEIFYIPQIRGFGIQGHPEYMNRDAPANIYIRKLIQETYNLPVIH